MTEKQPAATSHEYLELFTHLSGVIAQTTDLSSLLKASVQTIERVLRVESCSIMLLSHDGEHLNLVASSTIPAEIWPKVEVAVGEGVAGQVAKTGRPLLVTEENQPPGVLGTTSGHPYKTRSFLSIPIHASRGILGVINATDRVDGTAFSGFDMEMLQAVGKFIAYAIENHQQWVRAQRSHEHLSFVIDELPIGMLSISSDGLLNLCNKAARQYLRIKDVVDLDTPWEQHFREPVRTHISSALAKIARGRTSHIDEFEIPDGENICSVRMSAVVADYLQASETRRILFFIEDLQQMKELVDLRRSDQMKSSFLSLISHELRTPLASIKGAIHLLNQMDPAEIHKSGERIFTLLHRNIDRLSSLVNNILDAMDLDTQSLRLYRKRTDLHALMLKIVRKMMSLSSEKNIAWNLDLEDSFHGVYVDETRIAQVVEHLFENALKFIPANGKIGVRTRSIDGIWRLRVWNTGRCIEPALHEKIFSRFYQVDGTLTRYYGGSGLGLYLCREIIRLHGGDIQIDPAFTEGACFEVWLPEVTELA